MTGSARYLYCIPQGGLNDILTQIWKCLTYAKKYGRILVLNTIKGVLKEPIEKYIAIQNTVVYKGSLSEWFAQAKTCTVFPPELKEHIENMCVKYVRANTFSSHGIICSTDLSRTYSEDILIYVNGGGGPGINLLRVSSLQPIILREFKKRYANIPKPYTSFHIRNTDYKSDVPAFIEKYSSLMKRGPFFLASDDLKTIERIRAEFGSNMYTFSNIPECTGRNIHRFHDSQSNEEFNINTFCDLLVLACAEEYYFSCNISGYSRLARDLHADKRTRNRLLELE